MVRSPSSGAPHVSLTRDSAYARLKALQTSYRSNAARLQLANEAKTRLLLVDEILLLLGWPKESFSPETPTREGGFIDYLLRVDGVPRVIAEAKKAGQTFGPPSKGLHQTEYTLSYMRSAFGPALADVIAQASRYCKDTNVPFAVMTNGAEWVLAQTIPPPGTPVDKLRCFYFGDLLGDTANFETLWDLLSQPSVAANRLEEAFGELNSFEANYAVEPRALEGELQWNSPAESQDLEDFYDRFFDEIIDEGRRKMLEKVYVTSPRLDQYQGELKRALLDTAPAFVEGAQDLAPGDSGKVLPTYTGDKKGRVVLIVGSVGVGKTTFVTKAMIENRDCLGLSLMKIDLVDESMLHQATPERLWSLLRDEWLKDEPDGESHEVLAAVFHSELERLRRGPYKKIYERDEARYLEAEANELEKLRAQTDKTLPRIWRSQGRRVVLFLDNVDRASEAFQERMYAFAHSVATGSGATVIVPMREATYFRAKDKGFLDVRSNDRVFHLQAPDIVQIVAKRVQYVERYLTKDHRVAQWKASGRFDEFKIYAEEAAGRIKSTFLQGEEGTKLLGILGALAWHNIRAFLATMKQVHTLLGAEGATWLRNHIVFSLATCRSAGTVGRLATRFFRPPSVRHNCYLLKPRLCLFLYVGVPQAERRQGVTSAKLVEFCRAYGYRRRWTEVAIEELISDRILECLDLPSAIEFTEDYSFSEGHRYRLSPLGIITLEELQFSRAYLVTSGWQTPFHSQERLHEFLLPAKAVLDANHGNVLGSDAADLLCESAAADAVVSLLRRARKIEDVASPQARSRRDVAAVEERLDRLMAKFPVLVSMKDSEDRRRSGPTGMQQELPEIAGIDTTTVSIPIPPGLPEATIEGSTTGPLVFWALAFGFVNGRLPMRGADITRVINQYLRDDLNHLHNTNVSRVLRSPVLRGQKWLEVSGDERSYRYSLTPHWRSEWRALFATEAPA